MLPLRGIAVSFPRAQPPVGCDDAIKKRTQEKNIYILFHFPAFSTGLTSLLIRDSFSYFFFFPPFASELLQDKQQLICSPRSPGLSDATICQGKEGALRQRLLVHQNPFRFLICHFGSRVKPNSSQLHTSKHQIRSAEPGHAAFCSGRCPPSPQVLASAWPRCFPREEGLTKCTAEGLLKHFCYSFRPPRERDEGIPFLGQPPSHS